MSAFTYIKIPPPPTYNWRRLITAGIANSFISDSDTGTVTELVNVAQPSSDSGTDNEVSVITAQIIDVDTGTSQEIDVVNQDQVDTGTGTEVAPNITQSSSDIRSSAETNSLVVTTSFSDSGTDAESANNSQVQTDSGTITESWILVINVVDITGSDSATATDIVLLQEVKDNDLITGTETFIIDTASWIVADTASTNESYTIAQNQADSITGIEFASIPFFFGTDTGTEVENVPQVILPSTDIFTVSEITVDVPASLLFSDLGQLQETTVNISFSTPVDTSTTSESANNNQSSSDSGSILESASIVVTLSSSDVVTYTYIASIIAEALSDSTTAVENASVFINIQQLISPDSGTTVESVNRLSVGVSDSALGIDGYSIFAPVANPNGFDPVFFVETSWVRSNIIFGVDTGTGVSSIPSITQSRTDTGTDLEITSNEEIEEGYEDIEYGIRQGEEEIIIAGIEAEFEFTVGVRP